MNRLDKAINQVVTFGAIIGAVSLAGMMLLTVATVFCRAFRIIIPGSYELIELLIIVTVSFSLSYTAIKNGHITVIAIVSRLPHRIQRIISSIIWFLGLCIMICLTYASIDITREKWLLERSETIGIPLLPFRFVWIVGLVLFCTVIVIHMISEIKKAIKS